MLVENKQLHFASDNLNINKSFLFPPLLRDEPRNLEKGRGRYPPFKIPKSGPKRGGEVRTPWIRPLYSRLWAIWAMPPPPISREKFAFDMLNFESWAVPPPPATF